jgi:hypothetical protein
VAEERELWFGEFVVCFPQYTLLIERLLYMKDIVFSMNRDKKSNPLNKEASVTLKNGSTLRVDTVKQSSTLRIHGHKINLSEDDRVFCESCTQEHEIPEVFAQSSPFRQVVYKMYLLGKFKERGWQKYCDELEDTTIDSEDYTPYPNKQIPNPGQTYWFDAGDSNTYQY